MVLSGYNLTKQYHLIYASKQVPQQNSASDGCPHSKHSWSCSCWWSGLL